MTWLLARLSIVSLVLGVLLVPGESPATAAVLAQAPCNLYPIALSTTSVTGVASGTLIQDIYNGVQPGNFGWLTWAGSPSEPTLVASLTPPGNSQTYVNPDNSTDHTIASGKRVFGKPGVSNSRGVRDALNVLETMDIVVPVWDFAQGQGSNATYHIVNFAVVRITDYRLPSQNRISAIFKGFTTCGGGGIE